MMGWYNDGAGGWAVMGLMVVLWVALLGAAVWAGLHFLRGEGSRAAAAPTPRAVLDNRLAAGQIDPEQYATLRRLLDGQSADTVSTEHPRP